MERWQSEIALIWSEHNKDGTLTHGQTYWILSDDHMNVCLGLCASGSMSGGRLSRFVLLR